MQETVEIRNSKFLIRIASISDIEQITKVYNQGIQDRVATLEGNIKSLEQMQIWFNSRNERYKVLVIEDGNGHIKGWASLNVFNVRECYKGVADLSIYIRREERGKGLGKTLLMALLQLAKQLDFYKMVLSTFAFNDAGQKLYTSVGFTKVGTYTNQGMLDGRWVDITIMEKRLIDDF